MSLAAQRLAASPAAVNDQPPIGVQIVAAVIQQSLANLVCASVGSRATPVTESEGNLTAG